MNSLDRNLSSLASDAPPSIGVVNTSKYVVNRSGLNAVGAIGLAKKIVSGDFKFSSGSYRVTMKPVRMKNPDGREEECYLGEREQVVESVVRHLAGMSLRTGGRHRRQSAVTDAGDIGCSLTFKQIDRCLKRSGYKLAYSEIAQALKLLNQVRFEIESLESKHSLRVFSSAFPVIAISGEGEEGKVYVSFNSRYSEIAATCCTHLVLNAASGGNLGLIEAGS